MAWRRPGDWRWVAAALLIAALVLGLGFVLRASGLGTAANVAQLVSLAPLVVGLANWPRSRKTAAQGLESAPLARLAEHLRTIAYAQGLTGQDVRERLPAWDGDAIDAYLNATQRPSWDFVVAFLDAVAGDERWRRELLEQRIRPLWEAAAADRPDRGGVNAPGNQQAVHPPDSDDWLEALQEAAKSRQAAAGLLESVQVHEGLASGMEEILSRLAQATAELTIERDDLRRQVAELQSSTQSASHRAQAELEELRGQLRDLQERLSHAERVRAQMAQRLEESERQRSLAEQLLDEAISRAQEARRLAELDRSTQPALSSAAGAADNTVLMGETDRQAAEAILGYVDRVLEEEAVKLGQFENELWLSSPQAPPAETPEVTAGLSAAASDGTSKPSLRGYVLKFRAAAAVAAAAAIAVSVAVSIYLALPATPTRTTSTTGPDSTASGSSSTSGVSTSASHPRVTGGTATVALPVDTTLNYIWPYMPVTGFNGYNAEDFQMLMYRPLYMFGDNGDSETVNYSLSTADAPVYSDGDKTVTITLKDWKWSDGEAVDAADVMFWLNMMKAESSNYYGYVAGLLPDDLASYSETGPDTVVLHLKSPVSSIWFTYNQLAEITPMPEAWDVRSAGARPGSGGCSANISDCAAVYKFLSAQAQDTKTYATNPLWAVVDGPWKLSSYSTASTGPVASFVPNRHYSGSPKPSLAKFTYYAFTNATAEYTALKNGQIDVGYIPMQDLPTVSDGQVLPSANPLGSGFTLEPSYVFGIQFFLINFNNPVLGPAFKQLYVRQALQEVIDQEGMIKTADNGYGYPTSGPIPEEPASQWVPAIQKENGGQGPYPFSISGAMELLTSHGWSKAGGVMTCEKPSLCGAGVAAGTKLSMTMDYAPDSTKLKDEFTYIKTDAAKAGIDIKLVPQPFFPFFGTWGIVDYGGWTYNGPGFEPTGELLFATGAAANSGSYSDPTMDNLITRTHTSSSLSAFQQYAAYAAQQLPFIWMPNTYTVQAVNSKLANVTFNPLTTFLPEYWFFTS